MWRDFICSLSKEYSFKAPATHLELSEVIVKLNVEPPKKLTDLLRETNGVFDCFHSPIIWPCSKIVQDNLFFRNFKIYKDIYMSFDDMFFFSDNGCGDLFGFKILNGSVQSEDIYGWNHEDDSRTRVATSLEAFIKGMMTDEITI